MKLKKFNENFGERYYEDINLKIGKRVVDEFIPFDEYELVVDNMHGDGNANTVKTKNFTKDEVDLLKFTLYLLNNLSMIDGGDYVRVIWDHQEMFDEFDQNDLGDYLYDILDHDASSNGEYYCNIHNYRVFYYDNNGIKYNVSF